MPLPLTVYLDSSDISNLARPSVVNADSVAEIRHQFNELVQQKKVTFPVSLIQILEIIHMEEKHRELAIERAKVVKELSGGFALRWVSDLFFRDALAMLDIDIRNYNQHSVNEDGNWLPSTINTEFKLISNLRNDIKTQLRDAATSRSERRQVDKLLFKGSRIRPKFAPLVDKALASVYEKLEQQLPVTERFKSDNLLLSLLLGRTTEQAVCRELMKGFCDPVYFISWYADLFDKDRSVTGALRRFASKIGDQINEVRAVVRTSPLPAQETKSAISAHRLDTAEFRARLIKDLFTNNKDTLKKAGVNSFLWRDSVVNSNRGELQGIDTFLDILGFTYQEDMSTYSERGDVKDSAVADLMHALYLPYVDLFRADRSFAHRLKVAVPKYQLKVVTTLRELPAMIQTALTDAVRRE